MSLELQQFTRGIFTVEAALLTEDNLWDVFEWADSKPFYGPKTDEGLPHPVTGLTVFTPTGRVKAEFGDWVYRTPVGDFKTKPDAEFRENFTPAEKATR